MDPCGGGSGIGSELHDHAQPQSFLTLRLTQRGLRQPRLPSEDAQGLSQGPELRDATLLITHSELCSRHGVGAVLSKIFADDPALIVIYSLRLFDGDSGGSVTLHFPHPANGAGDARHRLADFLNPHQIRRIFCVPHLPDDARNALAAAELLGAPLVTYIMDDQNLFFDGISDDLMKALIDRSSLCLAISPILQSGYRAKFGRRFWWLPPVNEERLFAPPDFPGPSNRPARGVIIGNLWSSQVLQEFRRLIRVSGLRVDWFGNAGKPYLQIRPTELMADGIALHPNLADQPLVEELRRSDYGIMPSWSLGEDYDHDWLFRGSLPSRLIYMLTTAHLPLVVLGDAETAAGEFVTRLGLGVTSPYDARSFADAVAQVTDPATRRAIRTQAARLSPVFASEPVADWVWQSAEAGRPADDRYERLSAR